MHPLLISLVGSRIHGNNVSGQRFHHVVEFLLGCHNHLRSGPPFTGRLQAWVSLDDPRKRRLLLSVDIDEEDVLSRVQVSLEAHKVSVGLLDTEEAAFPGAEAEYDHRQE